MKALRRRLRLLELQCPENGCDHCRPIFDAPIRYIKSGEPEPGPMPEACPKCGRERPDRIFYICPRRAEDRPPLDDGSSTHLWTDE